MPKRLYRGQRYVIKSLYDAGWNITRIANHLNTKWDSVKRWVDRDWLKDKPRNIKLMTQRETRQIKQNIINGSSIRKEARRTNKSIGYIHKKIQQEYIHIKEEINYV
jgi:IS30 family transposase